MQKRYIDFGAPVADVVMKELISGLTGKTVLSGGEMSVTSDGKLQLAPVWVALESPYDSATGVYTLGVLLHEDEYQRFLFTASSASSNYTIVVRHNDQQVEGGVSATFTLESGIIQNENVTNGLVLGWVLYPGGGIPLAQSMLIEAPKARIQAVVNQGTGEFQTAPFLCLTSHRAGPPVAITNGSEQPYVGSVMFVDNSTGITPSQDEIRWTFVCPTEIPETIFLDYVVSTGQILTLDIADCEGNSSNTSIPNTTFLSNMLTSDFSSDATIESYNSGAVVVKRKRLRITNGDFTPGKRFRIQATVQTPAGGTNQISAVGHSRYSKPISTP